MRSRQSLCITFMTVAAVVSMISFSAVAAPGHSGTVVEVLDAARYTYVQLTNETGAVWVVGPQTEIQTGAVIRVEHGMEMRDFPSRVLKRRFETIYFVSSLKQAPDTSEPTAPLPPGHPMLPDEKVERDVNMDIAGIKVPEKGISIVDLYARKEEFAGKTVTVRGRVFEYRPSILGRNWMHIRDASSEEENRDVTLTTSATVERGDVITAGCRCRPRRSRPCRSWS